MMYNTISEIKNSLEVINSRTTEGKNGYVTWKIK